MWHIYKNCNEEASIKLQICFMPAPFLRQTATSDAVGEPHSCSVTASGMTLRGRTRGGGDWHCLCRSSGPQQVSGYSVCPVLVPHRMRKTRLCSGHSRKRQGVGSHSCCLFRPTVSNIISYSYIHNSSNNLTHLLIYCNLSK